jgi:hypothetical protein
MAGLVPAIHDLASSCLEDVDARDKRGHDELFGRDVIADRPCFYSAASLCPSRALSLWISSSAASEITVPGGKIASAPAL